eukprot:CAMPEP_0170372722 /NCGR_PEP_ID=MMETSP0117_2-20130122/9700_1 /TAXON_ID=400756 /ORGANISM="Durinskia baltica, Strain CSIRO CS-38" /LENGTH=60 /DNA_ID=CAMNT_0010627591 /DNA_START=42 /DNA_END=220 /DNA_ORIENTATION=+
MKVCASAVAALRALGLRPRSSGALHRGVGWRGVLLLREARIRIRRQAPPLDCAMAAVGCR